MFRRILMGLLVCMFSLGFSAAPAEEALTDDERFTLLTAPVEDQDPAATADLRIQRFAELWSDDDYGTGLTGIEDADVRLRLRAADSAMRGPGAPDWVVARFQRVLTEASARGLARPQHYRQLFDFHMLQLNLEQAAEVRRLFPAAELPEIPVLHRLEAAPEAGERRVWLVSGGEVTEVSVPPERTGFVVEASTVCGFVRRAAVALGQDDLLSPLVARHGLWLAGAWGAGSLENLAAWNGQFPDMPIHLVADQADWPELEFFATPRFVFSDQSGEIATIMGWSGGSESLVEFAQRLSGLGLLDAGKVTEARFAYADQPAARQTCATRQPALRVIYEQAPVTSPETLQEHLQEAGNDVESPLFLLSEPARERLIASMRFREGASPDFRVDDILELPPEDRYAIVSLFGNQHFFAGYLFPVEMLNEAERDLLDRFMCAGPHAETLSPD